MIENRLAHSLETLDKIIDQVGVLNREIAARDAMIKIAIGALQRAALDPGQKSAQVCEAALSRMKEIWETEAAKGATHGRSDKVDGAHRS